MNSGAVVLEEGVEAASSVTVSGGGLLLSRPPPVLACWFSSLWSFWVASAIRVSMSIDAELSLPPSSILTEKINDKCEQEIVY